MLQVGFCKSASIGYYFMLAVHSRRSINLNSHPNKEKTIVCLLNPTRVVLSRVYSHCMSIQVCRCILAVLNLAVYLLNRFYKNWFVYGQRKGQIPHGLDPLVELYQLFFDLTTSIFFLTNSKENYKAVAKGTSIYMLLLWKAFLVIIWHQTNMHYNIINK